MTDTGTWVGAVVAIAALIFSIATYWRRRGKSRLEYVVLTRTQLLPAGVANELEVAHDGVAFADPALTVVRLVSVGDEPIRLDDFETDLSVSFDGVQALMSASWSAVRPADLQPEMRIEENRVRVAPAVINPGDMLELQVLSAGCPSGVSVGGRVAGLSIVEREALPYPPGIGSEGEMSGFDKFMWVVAIPAGIILAGVALGLGDDVSRTSRVLIAGGAALVLAAYVIQARYLVERRRRWRP